MLKNLKVGRKIMLGFGVILALLLVLSAVVLTANILSISNINNSSDVSDFQTLTNTLLDSYNDARVGANIIYTKIDDKEYQRVVDDYEKMTDYLNQLDKMASESKVLNQFTESLTTNRTNIDNWFVEVQAVQNYNDLMAKIKGQVQESSAYVAANASTAFAQLEKLLNQDIANSADSAALRERVSLLSNAESIELGIYETRRISSVFFESLNTNNIGDFFSNVSSTKELMNTYISNTKSLTMKSDMETLLKNYTDFSNLCDNFITGMYASADRISKAQRIETTTTADILGLSFDLDDVMAEKFDATSNLAGAALIIIVVIAAAAFIIGIIMSGIIVKSITTPLSKMYNITKIVADSGRMHFSEQEVNDTKSAVSGDEIGQTVLAFVTMMDRLVIIAQELEKLSDGDLTIDIIPISEDDTMSNALKNTIDNLNEMFSSINSASEQVSSGSKQIADGAQTLATGSTEQASSIEELSSAIYEIAQATKENSKKASTAAQLTANVKAAAETGEKEMSNLMQAVLDINESSKSISKVIKAIDDIAFQTNILALNAAVEAARAGAAGKGFAVVADEVRNLASKSAEAAKNTSDMISSSISKADMGTKIANETYQSLTKIVSGVVKSTEIINDIAASSEDQSMKIDQINIGIGQVSEVVQQNSATAEESAAASEEMNGQTVVLADLVSQFKLKN